MGEAVPVFLYTLLAVRDILVDFDHLCLKHYPVGLQPREHIDKVRLGLCAPHPQRESVCAMSTAQNHL